MVPTVWSGPDRIPRIAELPETCPLICPDGMQALAPAPGVNVPLTTALAPPSFGPCWRLTDAVEMTSPVFLVRVPLKVPLNGGIWKAAQVPLSEVPHPLASRMYVLVKQAFPLAGDPPEVQAMAPLLS